MKCLFYSSKYGSNVSYYAMFDSDYFRDGMLKIHRFFRRWLGEVPMCSFGRWRSSNSNKLNRGIVNISASLGQNINFSKTVEYFHFFAAGCEILTSLLSQPPTTSLIWIQKANMHKMESFSVKPPKINDVGAVLGAYKRQIRWNYETDGENTQYILSDEKLSVTCS